MAAGKNQAQAVAKHGIFRLTFTVAGRSESQLLPHPGKSLELVLLFFETHPPSYQIDGFVARRRHQPCPWVLRTALPGPLFDGHSKRFLSHLLGQIEVSEEANQGGENSC